jgi:murein DD-endopeptidase MepM/ murein hydrolase activator NlpD
MGLRPDIHRGVDLDVPEGTLVHAMNDGRVRYAGIRSGYGNVVWLEHEKNVLNSIRASLRDQGHSR